MTLDSIRCFCAVVDAGSFRRAAERVHRSQPAVTQQIKGIEREMGQQLLDRKTCTPTPAGRIVYERGRLLLNGAENLQREVSDFDETGEHQLRVGASDTNALYFLPPHVAAFTKVMPQARLVVHCRSSDAIASEVLQGELDLGIVTLPMERDGLETRKLFEQNLVVVTPKGHQLGGQKQTTLARLREESFILIHDGTRTGTQLRSYFQKHNFEPRAVMDSGSFEVIKQYVAEGLGISIIPEMTLREHDLKRMSAVRLPGLPRVAIGVIWRTNAYQTRGARAFLDHIQS